MNLDLIVNTGVIQGLLGANGAGKTTLIKIIADLIDKESGKIYICLLYTSDAADE